MEQKLKEYILSNNYYVKVRLDKKYKNVILAEFPANIYMKPHLENEIYQYYFEEDQIICTNLRTKNTGKIKVTQLNKRTIFSIDILSKCIKRQIPLELIIAEKRNKSCPLTALITQKKNLINRESELFKNMSKIINNESIDIQNSGMDETLKIYRKILETGGIIS